MEESAFIEFIEKYLKPITLEVVKRSKEKNYMFKAMLRPEYSVSGKWESLSIAGSNVSADFIAMDSATPVKKRDSVSIASGDIAKSGMKFWLNEKQLSELITMIKTGKSESSIVAKLFNDTPKVINGIYELMEATFLAGLSSGVTAMEDLGNKDGLGVRLNYGYLNENKKGVEVKWETPQTAKPLDDIRKVLKLAKSKGNTITNVYMDDATFENLIKSPQVKEFYAFGLNFVGTNIPEPSIEALNKAFMGDSRYKFTIKVIDRTVVKEKDGKRSVITPWEAGKVIFTTTKKVGVLAWTETAEQELPVDGVRYETADDYILVSKYRKNEPVSEFTASQARVVPVICDVDKIYQLDTKVVQG